MVERMVAEPKQATQDEFRKAAASLVKPQGETASRSDRAGKSLIAGHFDPAVQRELRILAAHERATVQSLLESALRLLFESRQRPWPVQSGAATTEGSAAERPRGRFARMSKPATPDRRMT